MEADARILLGRRVASMLSSNGVVLAVCRIPSIHSGSFTYAILSLRDPRISSHLFYIFAENQRLLYPGNSVNLNEVLRISAPRANWDLSRRIP